MAELLTGIEITGYRQFERFRMDGLRRVNLLVGKNNAGKTALLEAVQILTTRPALGAIYEILEHRGEIERYGDPKGQHNGLYPSVRHLFPNHVLPEPGEYFSVAAPNEYISVAGQVSENYEDADLFTPLGAPDQTSRLRLDIIEDRAQTTGILLSRKGVMYGARNIRLDITQDRFVSVGGLNAVRMAALYDRMLERETEAYALEALQVLDSAVTSVAFLAGVDHTRRNPASSILIGSDGKGRQSIGSVGEGMRRMLGLALALSNAQGGVLLLDEIDTGLHHSVMGDLWRLVTTTARNLDIQVFATTHSLDCVRGIVGMGQEDPSLFEEIAVHTIDARRGQSVATAGERLDDAVQLEVELR